MSDVIRIAHRGASGNGHAPENTLAAFQKAIEIGVDGVECDVHCTADGQVVVIHDHTTDRTTDIKGTIERMTLAEVKEADAGSWFGPEFAGERIPTLREVLKLTKGKVVTVVEIKQRGIADKVIKEIRDAKSVAETVLISFHESALRDAQKIHPRIPRAFLVGGKKPIKKSSAVLDLIQQAVELGGALDLSKGIISPQLVKEAHRRGVSVWAWTVDDEAEMKKLAAMGVDAITSNYPEKLNSVFQ
jgi:glycerophosphoryl diester phosphodiesterase